VRAQNSISLSDNAMDLIVRLTALLVPSIVGSWRPTPTSLARQ
jgi:hypothetical protein